MPDASSWKHGHINPIALHADRSIRFSQNKTHLSKLSMDVSGMDASSLMRLARYASSWIHASFNSAVLLYRYSTLVWLEWGFELCERNKNTPKLNEKSIPFVYTLDIAFTKRFIINKIKKSLWLGFQIFLFWMSFLFYFFSIFFILLSCYQCFVFVWHYFIKGKIYCAFAVCF